VLKWSDFDGETLTVKRKLWKTHIGTPKTLERSKPVYVIQPLQKMLVAYRKEFQPPKDGWIFYGMKHRRPLSLDNLSRRDMPQFINGAWFGWHAFRRGLGSRLNELGVPDAIVQSILRHSQVSTTQAYYIKPTAESTKRGLQKLAKVAATKYRVKL
jgi:integrase